MSDTPTVLHFTSSALGFCSQKPSLLFDLQMVSAVLDFLVSRFVSEAIHQPGSGSALFNIKIQEAKTMEMQGLPYDPSYEPDFHPEGIRTDEACNRSLKDQTGSDKNSKKDPAELELNSKGDEAKSESDSAKDQPASDKDINQAKTGLDQKSGSMVDDQTESKSESQRRSENVDRSQRESGENSAQRDLAGSDDPTKSDENFTKNECDEKSIKERTKSSGSSANNPTDTDNDSSKGQTGSDRSPVNNGKEPDVNASNKTTNKTSTLSRKGADVSEDEARLMELIVELLEVVRKRNATSLYDRDRVRSTDKSLAAHVLGHTLSCAVVLCLLSSSSSSLLELRNTLLSLVSRDDDDDDDDEGKGDVDGDGDTLLSKNQDAAGSSKPSSEDKLIEESKMKGAKTVVGVDNSSDIASSSFSKNVQNFSEKFLELCRTSEVKQVMLCCLSSFFSTGSATSKGSAAQQKLPKDKAAQFGKILKLNLNLTEVAKPFKMVLLLRELSRLVSLSVGGVGGVGGGGGVEGGEQLETCVSAVLVEVERREKVAETRRRNPSLTEVTERVTKRLPRWKCE
jgi:hypothetical protein